MDTILGLIYIVLTIGIVPNLLSDIKYPSIWAAYGFVICTLLNIWTI